MNDFIIIISLVGFYLIAILIVVAGFIKFDKAWKEDLEDLDETKNSKVQKLRDEE